jgi:hypothetical protein
MSEEESTTRRANSYYPMVQQGVEQDVIPGLDAEDASGPLNLFTVVS